ncbi:1-acyl-sn-glycerol-3-phosphate acyltransferase [Antricoccus suffuscus]|uniref:1-acyl-sn-glycerol-3-phosphate acyltransferase n=1 Tax=Antricoccus suffuscus TaxID=1629062 RepID=A0A2T0ZX98_9ACTN|nr:lysophospholipid acyltransferase family protein [Antricoccus suffuscus]PRZ40708.1 1-acyl-sn-glycerol-3-phosphate acyltransferase [Antricoccus suffuscus]
MATQDDDWFGRQQVTAVREPWWFWQFATRYGYGLISLFGRIEITGSIDERLMRGPILLAPNHIGNFDAMVLTVACRRLGLSPRFLVTAGIMTAPVVGRLLEKSGSLRVNRGQSDAHNSTALVDLAIAHGAHLIIYPEGRVSLDPGLWPERGKTGLARIALAHRIPVIPVSQWGAHEVVKYEDNKAMLRSGLSSVWRQPKLRVHFGQPVSLDDLRADRRGDAVKARDRIAAAITRNLRPLRATELRAPRYVDETRPLSERRVAAFPGGVVPDDIP